MSSPKKRRKQDYDVNIPEKRQKLINNYTDLTLQTDQFVWKKKNKQLAKSGIDPEKERERRKQEELKRELIKARERRLQRQLEREKWERERDRLARERESINYQQYLKEEEEFHLRQAKLRSEIRIKEGRANAADLLSKNLTVLDGDSTDFVMDITLPYDVFKGKSLQEIEKLREEIVAHAQLGRHRDFWDALLVICDDEIKTKHKENQPDGATGVRKEAGIHESVKDDVKAFFDGKTHKELIEAQEQIQDKISNPDSGIDVEYWEAILQYLQIYKARALLKEIYDKYTSIHTGEKVKGLSNQKQKEEETNEKDTKSILTEDEMFKLVHENEEEGDVEFNDEIAIQQTYPWSDKYKPRKPRYCNRVHTGYEWNKYNQAHYDQDNPPPKIVQGYKFNIFYPDLIDKSKTPTYTVEPGDTKETCIIRFHAGPPYEDIAFKIVNKEWEKSHRRGFKATFERGVLHLHFNFKKYKYRR